MDIREARRQQTLAEACRLSQDVEGWLESTKARDQDANGYRGRYDTQLDTISSEVLGAAEKVRNIATTDPVTRPVGEVFSDYSLHDQRLVWIRYAWSYFKDKLDQRDNKALNPALEAADEVSWSCYSSFFVQAALPIPPAPIPYIEYDYVPSALRTGQAHVLNRRPGLDGGVLKGYFAKLPVPLLRLPPAIVTSPWSLALIAHEVGHILQGSVEPAQQYFITFADLVQDKAAGAGAKEDEQKQWVSWSQEIFADLCMASTLGTWSIWALAPWILTNEEAMAAPLDYYPPPKTRLYLLREFARAAGFEAEDRMTTRVGLADEDLPLAEAVASLASAPLAINGENKPLQWFLNGQGAIIAPGGRAYRWSEVLTNGEDFLAENDKTSARDAALATTRAHFQTVEGDSSLTGLCERSLRLMRECYDVGKRTGRQPDPPKQSLADVLFQLKREDLL